jgi:hypothetical protein
MAASGTAPGLSSSDLEQIREGLAAGRRPKVVFTASAGQISGQVGQVIRLDDPQKSDEWVVVRFGKDELPFSPADMAIPARGSSRRRAEEQPPEFKLDTKVPAPRATPAAAARPTTTARAKPSANGTAVKPTLARGPAGPTNAATKDRSDEGRRRTKGGARASGASAKGRAPLTVTLAYADREWTVAARLGSKVLAKPYAIKPAEALRMVSLLDVPGVHDAVENIIAAERIEAEDRARHLRTELAELEARLSELTGRA